MKLENWEILGGRAYGNVYGNPRFKDGESVVTSLIVERTETSITTKNSVYELGKPLKEGE